MSPKSLRNSLRKSKPCLEFLANIPLQSLVRERASDGRVAWLSLSGGGFLGSLYESVRTEICTSECCDSLCLLHEVTCSQELFEGAVDSLVTSEVAQTQQRKQGTVRNSWQSSLPSRSYLNPRPVGRGEHREQPEHGSRVNKGHVLK